MQERCGHLAMAADIYYDGRDIEDNEPLVDCDLKNAKIHSTTEDFVVSVWNQSIDEGRVIIPDFQRRYVWNKRQASSWIETLLLDLPTPQIFLYKEPDLPIVVLDGQQRLLSLYFFEKGKFPKKKFSELNKTHPNELPFDNDNYFVDFKLEFPSIKEYTSNQYASKTYDDVSSDLKWKPIRTILIKPQKPDINVKYEIFRRLNAGVPLKGHEIRRCIFPSPFYTMLKEINEDEKWRKMFSANGRPDPHMKDEELLLRGFAMLEDNDKYAGTVSKFLNDYSKKAQSYNGKKIKQLKQLFISFLENNSELSDLMRKTTTSDKPSSSISPLIFESVFVGRVREDQRP